MAVGVAGRTSFDVETPIQRVRRLQSLVGLRVFDTFHPQTRGSVREANLAIDRVECDPGAIRWWGSVGRAGRSDGGNHVWVGVCGSRDFGGTGSGIRALVPSCEGAALPPLAAAKLATAFGDARRLGLVARATTGVIVAFLIACGMYASI